MEARSAVEIGWNDRICTITLNRPDLINRIDEPVHRALIDIFTELAGRVDTRCIIFASTGRHFSAGGDLAEIVAMREDGARRDRLIDQARRLFRALARVPAPIVAALHGDAFGLGANLVLACDIIVAARSARLGDPHVPMGLVAGDGGCVVWPQALGLNLAKRYLLTGDAMNAEVAYAHGLVTDLVDHPDDCLPAAQAIAQRIAALPPLAVRGTKRALNQILQNRMDEVFDLALELERDSLTSRDVLEAVSAFRERRLPAFTGE